MIEYTQRGNIMGIQLNNETAIKCIMHVIYSKINYGPSDAVKDILSIIDEQGADYILQEIIERLS